MMQRTDYPRVGETLWRDTLPNGLKLSVVTKPGFTRAVAAFTTNYGGADRRFRYGGSAALQRPFRGAVSERRYDPRTYFFESSLVAQIVGDLRVRQDRRNVRGVTYLFAVGANRAFFERMSRAFSFACRRDCARGEHSRRG